MNIPDLKLSRLSRPLLRLSFLIVAVLLITSHMSAATAMAAQANLSWVAPTTYTDGTPLTTSIAGYKVMAGTAPGSYSQTISIGNSTSYTLGSLNDGTTYYFAVSAFDSAGTASAPSSEVSFTTPSGSAALYTLTASAGSGGSISPAGDVVISRGESQTYTITPATGYKVAGVTVDGVSVGAVTSYTFSNVAANHTIVASFTTATSTASYSITATAYANGSISPAGTTTVASGGSKTYTITPAAGYKISVVKVDGVSIGTPTSYTFSNVTANHSIAVSFKVK